MEESISEKESKIIKVCECWEKLKGLKLKFSAEIIFSNIKRFPIEIKDSENDIRLWIPSPVYEQIWRNDQTQSAIWDTNFRYFIVGPSYLTMALSTADGTVRANTSRARCFAADLQQFKEISHLKLYLYALPLNFTKNKHKSSPRNTNLTSLREVLHRMHVANYLRTSLRIV